MSRSLKKGPYVAPDLLNKINKIRNSGSRDAIKTYARASVVMPEMVGLAFAVHDGRKFVSVFIVEEMVGHALGEFAPTRTFRVHSGQRKAGVVAETSGGGKSKPSTGGGKPSMSTSKTSAVKAPVANKSVANKSPAAKPTTGKV
jgi:small subunit ribosomal protein S19